MSPVVAAQAFLTTACDKRRNILDPIMGFCIQVLNQPKDEANARKRDGALHVIGSASDILMKVQTDRQTDRQTDMYVFHVMADIHRGSYTRDS